MRSLLLSVVLSGLVFYALATMLDTKNQTWLSKLPTTWGYLLSVVICLGYLLSLYWGFSRIGYEQRVANFSGILLSLCGLGCFLAAYFFAAGKNEAHADQFDREWLQEGSKDFVSLQAILRQLDRKPGDVKLLTYWNLLQSKDQIAVCSQQGEVIGLAIHDVKMYDLSVVSRLTGLRALILNNCQITNLKDLKLPQAERLNLNNNLLTDLQGIEAPKVKWLDLGNNPLRSFKGIENLPVAQYFTCEGIPQADRSALANHPFLATLNTK